MWVNEIQLKNVLSLFDTAAAPLRAEEVFSLYEAKFEVPISNLINSAISSLEKQGFLEKLDKVKSNNGAMVYQWRRTTLSGPFTTPVKTTSSKTAKAEADKILNRTLEALQKLQNYFGNLPDDQRQELLHYEVNKAYDSLLTLKK